MADERRDEEETLRAVARMWGIEPEYRTVDGDVRESSPEALHAVLRALGAPVGKGPGDIDALGEAARVGALRRWRRLTAPVVAAWEDERVSVEIRVPLSAVDASIECRLTLDSGGGESWTTDSRWLETVDTTDVEGERHLARRMLLPRDMELPAGVHDLEIELDGRRDRTRILRAPSALYGAPGTEGDREGDGAVARRRDWALFLPLHALRTRRSRGTADLGDLEELARWTAQRGGGAVSTLPLHPAFIGSGDGPFDPSPYAPVSRLFWNELYADPGRAPELEAAPAARELLESEDFREASARLREADHVDYPAAAAHQRRALEPLVEVFFQGNPRSSSSWRGFLEANPDVAEYARFRAVTEHRGEGWREWPETHRPGELPDAEYDEAAARHHLYAQWLMERQISDAARSASEAGAPLHLDVPLGVHADGFDPWRWPELFAGEVNGGAPPDDFFAGGQDWGFPPLRPEALRRTGYAYLRRAMGRVMAVAETVRVDHVMGLHRLYWIPAGMEATDGVYVRYPADELWALLSIESHRHRTRIVGEDLGTVPGNVRETMDRRGAARSYVVPFELRGNDTPEGRTLPDPPPGAVASVGTHDTPTWAGWWGGRDIERREDAGFLDGDRGEELRKERRELQEALVSELEDRGAFDAAGTEPGGEGPDADAMAVLRAVLVALGESPAGRVVVSVEDLWCEEAPQNVPGVRDDASWRRKASHPLEAWAELPGVVGALAALDEARREGVGGDDGTEGGA